jgi:hypothetical protein
MFIKEKWYEINRCPPPLGMISKKCMSILRNEAKILFPPPENSESNPYHK